MREQYSFNRGAIKPIQCLSDACAMLKGNYGAFLGVLIVGILIIVAGSCIPLAPLMPPMMCGLYMCLFAMMNRQQFNTSTLFKGFDFFGQSFLASLVVTLPMMVLSVIIQVGIQVGMGGISVFVDKMKQNETARPEDVLPLVIVFFSVVGLMYFVLIAAAIILGMLTSFMYPLIVDRRLPAMDAVKLSFRAVLGNFFGVLGLMLLCQLLIIAGVMLFYVGALFVAPIVWSAWAIAYRRVFPLHISQPASHLAPAQEYDWTPPETSSRAGWILTFAALAIIGLAATGIGIGSYFAYQGIVQMIQKAQEEMKNRETRNYPPYGKPTPSPASSPTNNPPRRKVVVGGALNSQVVELPEPTYPAAAKAVKAAGAVIVQIEVNESGTVTSANAVTGHPLLRAAAVQAAKSARFKPTLENGKAVKVKGTIIYTFTPE